MPIFDYRCSECRSLYDIFHKGKEIVDDILCPHCGSKRYTKLMSIPASMSKGGASLPCGQESCGMPDTCIRGSCGGA